MPIFVKTINFCKKANFKRKSEGRGKVCKHFGKKFFVETNFCKRLRWISRKSDWIFAKIVFFTWKPILAKQILQTFLQCLPHYPHGVRSSNPTF
jgi:two-component SAPR family response regulator